MFSQGYRKEENQFKTEKLEIIRSSKQLNFERTTHKEIEIKMILSDVE